MEISSMTGANTARLQHTVQMSLYQSTLNTQAAQATVMLEQLSDALPQADAPHPTAGKRLDIRG